MDDGSNPLRHFDDDEGVRWTAAVEGDGGGDYKGRHYLVMRTGDSDGGSVRLRDVRWNSLKTARRTLATMSGVELRRRLRSAVGRARSKAATHGAGCESAHTSQVASK